MESLLKQDARTMDDTSIDAEINELMLEQNDIVSGGKGKDSDWYTKQHRIIALINQRSERNRQQKKIWNQQLVDSEKTQAESSKAIKYATWAMVAVIIVTAIIGILDLASGWGKT